MIYFVLKSDFVTHVVDWEILSSMKIDKFSDRFFLLYHIKRKEKERERCSIAIRICFKENASSKTWNMHNNNNTSRAIEIHREHHAIAMESPWLVKRYCTPRNKVISAPGAGIGVVGWDPAARSRGSDEVRWLPRTLLGARSSYFAGFGYLTVEQSN